MSPFHPARPSISACIAAVALVAVTTPNRHRFLLRRLRDAGLAGTARHRHCATVAGMKTIGRKPVGLRAVPSADGLREAARQQQIGAAFNVCQSTGIAKGVYRFRTHEEADAQRDEALSLVIAANIVRQRRVR